MNPREEQTESEQSAGGAALARILRDLGAAAPSGRPGGPDLLDLLSSEMSGTDLTTLLLEVLRRRAVRLTPAEVMRRYGSDRFVAPGTMSPALLRRAQEVMLAALPDGFAELLLAPVLPLGAHWVTGAVDPRKVIATIRGTEVAADPTNGLALEAADARRLALDRDARSADVVRLAATQEVSRAQSFSGPVSFAHFHLLGLVTAGRDTGNRQFESAALAEHLSAAARGLLALGIEPIQIAFTCLDEPSAQILAAVRDELAGLDGVQVAEAPERESGRNYYRGLCFKVFGGTGDSALEVGDGGFVDWTAKLIGSHKERLLISGYGLNRIAAMITAVSRSLPPKCFRDHEVPGWVWGDGAAG